MCCRKRGSGRSNREQTVGSEMSDEPWKADDPDLIRAGKQANPAWELQIEVARGVEL